MILVDTSVWIDYFNGVRNDQTDHLDQLLVDDQILMGDLILAEILQGFRSDKDFERALSHLQALNCVSIVSASTAIQSAEHFRLLRKQGVTIRKTVDMLIATWCINSSVPLLHNDRDFTFIAERLPLKVVK